MNIEVAIAVAVIAVLYLASRYVVRHELKRRAASMSDNQLRVAMFCAEGIAEIIYRDELERREVAATMMARVL